MPTIVPDDFHEQLLTLLPETRRWMSTYFTGSNKDLVNTLTFYSPQNAYKDCNIILVPGIATNTDIDPLMQLISYYALTHRYNLFCVNTFINRFKRIISPNSQPTQIWQDYTDSLNIALEQITYTSKQTYSCLIGHSAGATGIISTLNKAVDNNQTYHISRVLLFAPFVNDSWYQTLKTFSQRNHNNMDTIFLSNIFNTKQPKTYVPIQEAFLNSLAQQPFEPKKMGKWGTKITIVAGTKDKKAPIQILKENYNILKKQTTTASFVELPNTKHNFLNLPTNTTAIIEIIKHQRI